MGITSVFHVIGHAEEAELRPFVKLSVTANLRLVPTNENLSGLAFLGAFDPGAA
jgi:hypothetical protein